VAVQPPHLPAFPVSQNTAAGTLTAFSRGLTRGLHHANLEGLRCCARAVLRQGRGVHDARHRKYPRGVSDTWCGAARHMQ